MLSEGISTKRGRSGAFLHRDRVHGVVRGRRGARLAAITSGGAIPDNAQFLVLAEPDETVVGTLDEDFAVESMAGDVFMLGTTSWRIRRVEAGRVRVEDAKGAAPTIPFWRGEAPGRTWELSTAVSDLRSKILELSEKAHGSCSAAVEFLIERVPSRQARRRTGGPVRARRCGGARSAAERQHRRRGTILRRGRRHAAGAALAVRRAHQQGVGPGAAKALLPLVQFRASGGGDRQRHRHLAQRSAQLSARARVQVSEQGNGRRSADAGDAARADVRSALAMGHVARAGGAAICRRAEGAAADSAHARRRSARRGVSRSGGVSGKHRRRHPHSRSPARQRDDQGLPARGDGSRRLEAARRADRAAAS